MNGIMSTTICSSGPRYGQLHDAASVEDLGIAHHSTKGPSDRSHQDMRPEYYSSPQPILLVHIKQKTATRALL